MFFRNEIRKVLRFPLFWVMIACCAGLNLFVITDGMSYERIGIQAVNEYVRTGNVPSYDEYNVCVNYDEVKFKKCSSETKSARCCVSLCSG